MLIHSGKKICWALVSAILSVSPQVYAACSTNTPSSNAEVECKNGQDVIGVKAASGASNVSVVVRADGSIATGGDAIVLYDDSSVDLSGRVSSGSGIGVRLSGKGEQKVTINNLFGEVLGASYGIFAVASSDANQDIAGTVSITNGGLIGGPLNTGGIYANADRSVEIANQGRIVGSGTSGFGIDAVSSGAATGSGLYLTSNGLAIRNDGLIEVRGFGIRAQAGGAGNTSAITNTGDVSSGNTALEARGYSASITSSGTLRIMGGGTNYGIYGRADYTNNDAESAVVTIDNSGSIELGNVAGQGSAVISGYASLVRPDPELDNAGVVTVTNSGRLSSLGAYGSGIIANARKSVLIDNRGDIALAGFGAAVIGQAVEGSVTVSNSGELSGDGVFNLTASNGSANLANEGALAAKSSAVRVNLSESATVSNSGDVVQSGAGQVFSISAKERATLVNSGNITSTASSGTAIDISAASLGGTSGRVSVDNAGVLRTGASSASRGITALAEDGLGIRNTGDIISGGAAIEARSSNGAISITNEAALTSSLTGSYRIDAAVDATSDIGGTGSVIVSNSGRLQGGGGINAAIQAGNISTTGDVQVTNQGDIYTSGSRYAITVFARDGEAAIVNSGVIDGESSALRAQSGEKATIHNSGAIDVDNQGTAIFAEAGGKAISHVDVRNEGAILLNEKSRNGYGIQTDVDAMAPAEGGDFTLSTIVNTAAITSLGTNNGGISAIFNGSRGDISNSGDIAVQRSAISTLTGGASGLGGDLAIDSSGKLTSTGEHGIWAYAGGPGNVFVSNSGSIEAALTGITAKADQGRAAVLNSGDVELGQKATSYGTTKGAIVVNAQQSLITNEGAIHMTGSARYDGLVALAGGPNAAASVDNHGAISMGSVTGWGIYAKATASVGGGNVNVDNYAEIDAAAGAGIFAWGSSHIEIDNNATVHAASFAIQTRTDAGGTVKIFNDIFGVLRRDTTYGAAVSLFGNSGDTVTNAGVISVGDNSAIAIDMGQGDDTLEIRGRSKIDGLVQAGSGTDRLRWGGASTDRFDMGLVGGQYLGFENFEKTGSGIWNFDGYSTAIDHLDIREGIARIDGVLNGDVKVFADAILGGYGSVAGNVLIEQGGIYAPGASIGSMTLNSLTLSPDAVFQVEVDSDGNGGQLIDLTTVLGEAVLGGILELSFLNTDVFYEGWEASFLTAASITGMFDELRVAPFGGIADFELVDDHRGNLLLRLTRFETMGGDSGNGGNAGGGGSGTVPAPATLVLVLLGLGGIARRHPGENRAKTGSENRVRE